MKFFYKHVCDSIRIIARYNNDIRLCNFALNQLEILAKESARMCGLDYEKELDKALNEERLASETSLQPTKIYK